MVIDGKPVYSYSQLNTFRTCPYGWMLLYDEHVPREDNAFSQYGTLCHELLEKCAKGELTKEALPELFEWKFDTEISCAFPYNKYKDLQESYREQGMRFFENFEGFDDMEILGVEQHFYIDRGFYKLQGYIDLIYRNKGGALTCRDWKSTKKYSPAELREHAVQPYLYSSYCKEAFGRYPDYLEFYHFRDAGKRSVVTFNSNQYEQALQWADDAARDLQKEWAFPYKYDDWYCNQLCSARGSCEFRQKEGGVR